MTISDLPLATLANNQKMDLHMSMTRDLLRRTSLVAMLIFLPLSGAWAVTIKIASIAPDGTLWMQKMREGAEEISKQTDNRVKFKFYPGGIMGSDANVLRKIRIRQLHGGAVTAGSLATIYKDFQIYSLPLLFKDRQELASVREQFDQVLIDGLEKEGFVSFGLADGGFAYFMSQKPIASVSDMRKQRVWLPEGDEFGQAWFEATGVTPVTLPLTDVLTGLQTGLVDAVATSTIGALAFQWHTKVNYVTETPLLYLYGTLVIDSKTFKRIKPDDQRIVRDVMNRIVQELDGLNQEDDIKALAALRDQGLEFVQPTAAALEELRQTAATARDKLEQNNVVSPALLDRIEQHLNTLRNEP
jgi:TRAP-type C4-dicarboxylate transport system substrate-binding protein